MVYGFLLYIVPCIIKNKNFQKNPQIYIYRCDIRGIYGGYFGMHALADTRTSGY